MSDVGQWLRSALAAALVAPVVTGTALAAVLLAGVAGPPGPYQLGLLAVAAGLIGFAAWRQRRLSPAPGTGEPPDPDSPGTGVPAATGVPTPVATSVGEVGPGHTRVAEGRWARRLQGPAGGVSAVGSRPTGGHRAATVTASTTAPRPAATTTSTTASTATSTTAPRPAFAAAARWPGRRRAVLIGTAVVLAVALWLPLGLPARIAVAFGTFFFGYVAYALPLLPLVGLDVLPPVRRGRFPWALVGKRRYTVGAKRRFVLADQVTLARATRDAVREDLVGRPLGVLVAMLGLLHLLRDSPGFADTAYPRAGGLLGMAVGAPLGWLLSPAGAIALLVGLLATSAVETAELLRPWRGPRWASAGLAALLVVPLTGVTVGRLAGYDYYLGAQRGHVVVLAGVSRHERHRVADTGVAVGALPSSLRPLLTDGIPVDGTDDGVRAAKALAHPRAVAGFPADGGNLAVGDCFTTAGPSTQLRYLAPCSAAHAGEVYFIAALPLRHDPGVRIAEAVGRAICEAPYGAYLGVPYGQSYLPIETPLTAAAGWRPQGTIACWFGSVGPSSLRGTRTVAALSPGLRWDTEATGCTVTAGDSVTLSATRTGTRCVAPGRSHPEAASAGTLRIDASLMPVNEYTGAARTGLACLDGADARSGYYVAVSPTGGLELWKQVGAQRTGLATAKPRKPTAVTADAFFDLRLTCVIRPGTGVDLTASTGTLTVRASDRTGPLSRLSPRLFVESNDQPSQAVTVAELLATLT